MIDIARKLSRSTKVVTYRLRKMRESGLILGFRPIIDHTKLGFTYYKILINLNKTTKESLKRLRSYIIGNPNIIYIVDGVGFAGYIDVEIMVRSNKELYDFIEDLKFKFPALVGDYQTITFMDTLKVKFSPF